MLIALYSSTMQSGKTEIAKYLERKYNFKKMKFAFGIKQMIYVFISPFVLDAKEYIEGSKKNEIIPVIGKTSRYLQQTLGSEWGRDLVGNDIWINCLDARRPKNKDVVIDDMRFENEFEYIKNNNGICIKVVTGSHKTVDHRSENRLNNFEFDYVIYNDDTLQTLYKLVDSILDHENTKDLYK